MTRVVPSQVVTLINQLFPQIVTQRERDNQMNFGMDRKNEVAAVLRLISQIPSELITLDANRYSELQYAVAACESTLEIWNTGQECTLPSVPQFRNLHPIKLIYEAVALCRDEFPAPATTELGFITDADLRNDLRLDLSAVNTNLRDGEWKGSTVLAGALCEALLLWRLQQEQPNNVTTAANTLVQSRTLTPQPPNNLVEWNLHQYVEVANNMRLISDDTATQVRQGQELSQPDSPR